MVVVATQVCVGGGEGVGNSCYWEATNGNQEKKVKPFFK
jgi:hypothetical protein